MSPTPGFDSPADRDVFEAIRDWAKVTPLHRVEHHPRREKLAVAREVGMLLTGAAVAYNLYREMGAPRWAAVGLVDISLRLEGIRRSR